MLTRCAIEGLHKLSVYDIDKIYCTDELKVVLVIAGN
jgi:hypothetical protein